MTKPWELTELERYDIWSREFSPSGGMWGMTEITEKTAYEAQRKLMLHLKSYTKYIEGSKGMTAYMKAKEWQELLKEFG